MGFGLSLFPYCLSPRRTSMAPRLMVIVMVSDVTMAGWVALEALAVFVMGAPCAALGLTRTVSQQTVRATSQVGNFHWMAFPLSIYG